MIYCGKQKTLVGLSVVGILLILAVTPQGLSADCKTCAQCGEPLSGRYLEVEGQCFHAEHFLCDVCKRPIEDETFRSADGKFYHSKCYDEQIALRCASCGEIIGEMYYESEGDIFHPDCYASTVAPRCTICGLAILDSVQMADSLPYHYRCYWDEVVGPCAYCGNPITSDYVTDFWGNKYHSEHIDRAPECDYCGRLVSELSSQGGFSYSDGRTICGLCAARAVTDIEAAYQLMEEVADSLQEDGITVNTSVVAVALVDRDFLKTEGESGGDLRFGATQVQYLQRGNEMSITDLRINLLYGLPRILAYGTLAHELMHARLDLARHSPDSEQLLEGSCNYAGYLALKRWNENEAERDFYIQQMQNDSSLIYGMGFRKVKRLVEARGQQFWLDWIATEDEFPEGF